MEHAVRDNPAAGRFELEAEGHLAVSHYQLADGVMTFTHTEVDPAVEGRGIATRLIQGALDQARERGLKVVARCSFVEHFLAAHPAYADLRA